MPFDLYDAADPNKIPAAAAAVAGYMDGAESEWPAAGWDRWKDVPRVVISVLANPSALAFDAEAGDASNDDVAAAAAGRVGLKHPAWIYTNMDNYADVVRALTTKSLRFTDRSQWPAPGVYLWAADPSGNIAAGVWKPGLDPVAVQDRAEGDYDVSICYVDLAEASGPPAPAPQPEGPRTVQVTLPELKSEGAGPYTQNRTAVERVQAIVGAKVDGLFGPDTDAHVRAAQSAAHVAVDGVVGPITWSVLLTGAPPQ